MYKILFFVLTIKDIWSIPFDSLKLNEQTKNKCEELFGDDMDDNAIVIYSTSNDGIIVLVYYILDDLNITQSSMYEQLKINTFVFSNKDKTADLKEIKCKHIST